MRNQNALFILRLGSALLTLTILRITSSCCCADADAQADTVRFATFNVSLYGQSAGEVAQRLSTADDSKVAAIAEIIQRVRPHVLLLNEIDYDPSRQVVTLLKQQYLAVGQNVSQSPDGPAEPIEFPYVFSAPSNTGIHSGFDLDRNGRVVTTPGTRDYGGDCWGFGQYPGQYAMVLLSRLPIDHEQARTFRTFRWKDLPGALLPNDPETDEPADWYCPEMLEQFPLSSKSHWDVPIIVGDRTIHLLACHPTPPVFDGPEDRNGRRNHDELQFWVQYITPGSGQQLYDDAGGRGGLPPDESFVVMGDLNGDPFDGEGSQGISALLAAERITRHTPPESDGGDEQARLQGGANDSHRGNPRYDTLDAADRPGPGNLRLDYVLPSADLKIVASGVFWPHNTDALFTLVGTHPFPSSDHRLVWVDVGVRGEE